MRHCSPVPIPENVIKIACSWEKREKSRLFAIIGTSDISRELVDWVYDERNNLKDVKTLDVIIDCSGGDIEAAYQLVGLFRNSCKKMRVFVPDWAKSAATFFCLGADEIWMSKTAELGPLDAQIGIVNRIV